MFSEHLDDGMGPDGWRAIEQIVQDTVTKNRRVRPVLQSCAPTPNLYRVEKKAGRLVLDTNVSHSPVRLSCELVVPSERLKERGAIEQLARAAAARVGAAEDVVIAYGGELLRELGEAGGKFPNPPALSFVTHRGLTSYKESRDVEPERNGSARVPCTPGSPGHISTPGVSILRLDRIPETKSTTALGAVQEGILELQRLGHHGPYVALMLREMWHDASVRGAADDDLASIDLLLGNKGAAVLVPDPFDSNWTKKERLRSGVVASLGSGGFELLEVEAPSIAMVGYDEGDLVLRVEEQFLLRVSDHTAACDIALASSPPSEPPSTDQGQQGGGP